MTLILHLQKTFALLSCLALLYIISIKQQRDYLIVIRDKAAKFISPLPPNVSLRRAQVNESFLAYMHLAKTGGSSFNKMLIREPLSLLPVELNCGLIEGCCDSKFVSFLEKKEVDCPHFSYEARWGQMEKLQQKKTILYY